MATLKTGPGPGSGISYRNVSQQIAAQNILSGVGQTPRINQPFILDLVTLDKLYFQTIPLQLEYVPESKFASIDIPGRNNPVYQYTGSEDTLDFTITWYCDDPSRLDVILKCKWLEALTKNNGYDEKPHIVQFVFGTLFKDSKWLVEKAAYTLGRFNRQFQMLPAFAEQKVTLKRVTTSNLKRTEILKYSM